MVFEKLFYKNKERLLLIVALVYFSTIGNAQDFEGKDGKYNRKGYEIAFAYPELDTAWITDPVTEGKIFKTRQHILYPATVNGDEIYSYADVTRQAEQRRHKILLEDYILAKLSKRLKMLPDGSYLIKMQNVVVNKDGEIVYYELDGIVGLKDGRRYGGEQPVPATMKIPIDNEVRALMNNAPSMKPAKICDKRVAYFANVYLSDFMIDVENHEPAFFFRE